MADDEDASLSTAARLLQRRYRGYRQDREHAGLNLASSHKRRKTTAAGRDAAKADATAPLSHDDNQMKSSERWQIAMTQQQLDEASKAQHRGDNDPAARWQRTGFYAGRIVEGGDSSAPEGGKVAERKQMEAKYWLEMIDAKHRYGSNLKYYHARWNEENTTDSFFAWLDDGAGKHLDLPECSRKQLDSEQIVYLNAEQRRNYQVVVKDGLLVWARNGRAVDTAKGQHRDAGSGKGIIDVGGPEDQPEGESKGGEERPALTRARSSSSASYTSGKSGDGAGDAKEQEHYTTRDPDVSQRDYYLSTRFITDMMLHKTTKNNTWIYVMTGAKKLYVGIKQTGMLLRAIIQACEMLSPCRQHSSLAYGAQVISAGTLKACNGKLTNLTPLSGHYRSGAAHFENFVAELRRQGVNMHHVSVSKSLAVISAVETYGKAKKKKSGLLQDVKDKLRIGSKSQGDSPLDTESSDDAVDDDEAGRLHTAEQAPREQSDGPASDASDLPHEGRDPAQLSDKEKYKRGIALMGRAMSKGLKKGEEKV